MFLHCLHNFFFSDTSDKWLDAYNDRVASLYTFTQCMTLSDIKADGDWKLIIADLGTGSYDMKLKVYKSMEKMLFNIVSSQSLKV